MVVSYMFKDKNSELLFKLFLKEKNLTCNIETIHSTCICRIYINHIFGAKKCAHYNKEIKKSVWIQAVERGYAEEVETSEGKVFIWKENDDDVDTWTIGMKNEL